MVLKYKATKIFLGSFPHIYHVNIFPWGSISWNSMSCKWQWTDLEKNIFLTGTPVKKCTVGPQVSTSQSVHWTCTFQVQCCTPSQKWGNTAKNCSRLQRHNRLCHRWCGIGSSVLCLFSFCFLMAIIRFQFKIYKLMYVWNWLLNHWQTFIFMIMDSSLKI